MCYTDLIAQCQWLAPTQQTFVQVPRPIKSIDTVQDIEQLSLAGQFKVGVPLSRIEIISVKPSACEVTPAQQTFVEYPVTTGSVASQQITQVRQGVQSDWAKTCRKKNTSVLAALNITKLSEITPRELKLYKICRNKTKEIARLRKRLKNKKEKFKHILEDDSIEKLSKLNINNSFITFLQSQLQNCSKKPKGRRYTLMQKMMAVVIYKKSPDCYKLLRKMFALPCEASLNQLLNKDPLVPGTNPNFIESFQQTAQNEEE